MNEEEIAKKVELEFRMRDFTKYINSKLRKHERVEDWYFAINSIYEECLEVTIDYHRYFHSRDLYELEKYDIDELKRAFDFCFDKHLKKLEEGVK